MPHLRVQQQVPLLESYYRNKNSIARALHDFSWFVNLKECHKNWNYCHPWEIHAVVNQVWPRLHTWVNMDVDHNDIFCQIANENVSLAVMTLLMFILHVHLWHMQMAPANSLYSFIPWALKGYLWIISPYDLGIFLWFF